MFVMKQDFGRDWTMRFLL